MRLHLLLLTTLPLLAACTQRNPAQVELRGQHVFARSGSVYDAPPAQLNPSSYTTPSHAPMAPMGGDTHATASVSDIDITDVAAPARVGPQAKSSPASAAPSGGPFQPASASRLAPASGSNINSLNPWTGKPREVILDGAKDTPAAKTTAKPSASSGFIWPVTSKKVLSAFGPKGKGKVNEGINIASAGGEPVWAAADGEVVYADDELQGFGNMVLIKHSGDKTTTYAHMGRITVDKYERVKQGDIIGYVGASGNVKEPQLHFAVHEGKNPVDPVKFMKQSVASR